MAERYSTPVILLHWVTAVLVIVSYSLSESARHFEHDPPMRHFSVGFAVLILAIARVVARARGGTPLAHEVKPQWSAFAARVTQAILYVLLIAVPFSGWWALSKMGLAVSLFGSAAPIITTPSPDRLPGSMGRLHQAGGNLLLILAVVHGLAALWHQFVLKNRIFKRISPF